MTICPSPKAIQAAIQQDDPAATDQAVSALLASLEKLSMERLGFGISGSHGFEWTTTGYSISVQSRTDLQTAAQALEMACRPLSNAAIVKELTAMRVMTRVKDTGDDNAEFQIRVYADKLSKFPADAVKAVLRAWPDHSPWWPSWNELKVGLDNLCEARLMKRDALRQAAEAAEREDAKKRQAEQKEAACG